MRVIRHIAGLLVGTFGALFLLGALSLILDRDHDAPVWMTCLMFFSLGVLPLLGAFALLKPTLIPPERSCPRCSSLQRQPAGVLLRTHNPWIFHFGGWLFSSLWGASREQQVRCTECDKLYMIETKGTRIAGAILWIFFLLVIVNVLYQQFFGRE